MKALNNECAREAVNFIYKHGDLTYGSAYDAIQLLTSNGFAIYRTDGDEQVIYTEPDGKVWHPHRGYWCWKVSSELAHAQKRIKELEAEPAPAARSGAVKVKQLEWTKLSTGWIAHTPLHSYEVVKTDRGFMATYANRDFAWGQEDAMKAAAQADYERRILAALEPAEPATDVEPVGKFVAQPNPFQHIDDALYAEGDAKEEPNTRPPESRLREAADIAFDELFKVAGAPVARAVQQRILALAQGADDAD